MDLNMYKGQTMTEEQLQSLTIQDIEEIESRYYAEQEYLRLMAAYELVTANIDYYPEDQLMNLLDLITHRIVKDV